MQVALLHLFIVSANISFLLGLWLGTTSRKNKLLLTAFLGAGLLFTAAFLDQLEPPQPIPSVVYKAIPVLSGLLYVVIAIYYARRSFLQPNYRDRAIFAAMIALFHFGISAAAYIIQWPLGLF